MEMASLRAPALTICIPTYNRGKRVHALVLFLKQNLVPLTNDIQILVVNNCSDDGTQGLIEPLVGGPISLVNRTEFLDTGELNMYHSLALCKGEFVWYHGDDDIPSVETVLSVIAMIRQDVADFYVFNSVVMDDDGIIISRRMAEMKTSHMDVSADALVETAGFVFMLAGISNVIFRREYADVEIAFEASKIQPIYTHVCWFLACFAKHRTRIVNRPLVYYRNSDMASQIAHFNKLAKRRNIADQYFWGVGIALQFKWLVERGVIAASSFPRIFEGRRDGTRFKLFNQCVHTIYSQVVASVNETDSRFRIEPALFNEIRDFFVSCDLLAYDMFEPIEKINEIAMGQRPKKELELLKKKFNHIHLSHEADIYRNNWQGERSGYQIYRMACNWVAIKPEIPGGIVAVLAVIDLEEEAPLLLVDTDFEILAARAAAHAAEYTPKNSHGSLVELERIARQHTDLMHRLVHEYSHSIQIYRQVTWLGRALSYPIRRCIPYARRILGRWRSR